MKLTFGQLLRNARKTADVTIPQVAEHLGLSVGHISNVERGTAAPLADDKIIALGPLLKVNPQDLRVRASSAGFNERLNDSEVLQKMFADKLDKLADAFNEFRSFIVEQAVVTPDREGKTA